jgi:hypothetical protein
MFYVNASDEVKDWSISRPGIYFNFISEVTDEKTVAEVTPRHI